MREKSHWNSQNIRARDPVLLGLCQQSELNLVVARARKAAEKAGEKIAETPADAYPEPTPEPEEPFGGRPDLSAFKLPD